MQALQEELRGQNSNFLAGRVSEPLGGRTSKRALFRAIAALLSLLDAVEKSLHDQSLDEVDILRSILALFLKLPTNMGKFD